MLEAGQAGPFAPPALPGFIAVGSEEAHQSPGAGLRPPLKPDMQFSRIRLSQGPSPRCDGRNQINQIHKPHITV